ncbi:MAG TPA: hypothetical protein VHW60_19900 [Caulobacteraceae bacterium]|nr:hypothetical protein [Caulobacteraceae bacterium]
MSAARAVVLAGSLAAIAAGAHGQDNPIDSRVRASFDAAESFQGPLDGGWTLVDAAGAPIYAFQLVDKVGGRSPLEGVFRDLRHPSVPGDIGFIDGLERGAGMLTLRFGPVTIRLRSADGGWMGEIRDGRVATAVKLKRDSPPP